MSETDEWKRGFPEGNVSQDMLDTFEVYFAPGGLAWHRRRTVSEIAAVKSNPKRFLLDDPNHE